MTGLLTGTCGVYRPTWTQGDTGGPKGDFGTAVATGVRCRADDIGGGQVFVVDQQVIEATHLVFMLDPGVAVRNGDVVVLDDQTQVLRVLNVQNLRAAGSLPKHLEIYGRSFEP